MPAADGKERGAATALAAGASIIPRKEERVRANMIVGVGKI
jgi:hypothetical protein